MNRLRQKLVVLLTILAFLCPQIAGATVFELAEVHEIAGVVKTQRGAFMPIIKMHSVLDQEIYSSKSSDRSGAKDSSHTPLTGHRHCSFSLAGCMALKDAADWVPLLPMHDCRTRPSQQSLAGIIPNLILPPPKRLIQETA